MLDWIVGGNKCCCINSAFEGKIKARDIVLNNIRVYCIRQSNT